MKKTYYDSHRTISGAGRIGWTMVPLLADGTIDSSKPVIYAAGATTQAECLAMVGGAGKTTFKQETTSERGTIISYKYGSVVALDVDTSKAGGTRSERLAALLAADNAPLAKVEGKLAKAGK